LLLVEVDVHLGIARGTEPMALSFEHRAELAMVVDLAVLDDLDRPVLVADGLVSAIDVDDGKPANRERDRPVHERARAVRPSVEEHLVHGLERPRVDRATVERGESTDPAHGAGV
jgi:hypothetical protein